MGKEAYDFFKALGSRLWNENGLSDLTYALLESIPDFKKDFIKYFVSDLDLDNIPIESIAIEREYSVFSGRTDLFFYTPKWSLIVENKLKDTNYHFDQYKLHEDDLYYGLISNHPISPGEVDEEWEIRYWFNFVEEFGQKPYMQIDLFRGYMQYVKELCHLDLQAFKLDLSSLVALPSFLEMLKHVLNTTLSEDYTCNMYQRSNDSDHCGYYFSLEDNDTGVQLWPFWGIYLDGKPFLVELESDWNTDHFQAIESNIQENDYYTLTNEEGTLCLYCTDEYFSLINNEKDINKQIDYLRTFFYEACTALLEAIT